MSQQELVEEALHFVDTYKLSRSRNEKIIASRKVKEMILSINEFYKETKDQSLMDIMKRLTVIKKKIEIRLKIR